MGTAKVSRVGVGVLIAALLVAAGLSQQAYGQGGNAAISGTVADSSGAAVGDAAVQAKNVATGITRSATSDSQGRFSVPDVEIGDYEVQASKPGFQTVVRKGITLAVGAQAIVDFALPVGQTQTAITVEGQVSQVETSSSAISNVVEQKQIRELPLNGRSFTQLLTLAPGVLTIAAPSQGGFYGRGENYSVAGSRPEGQAFLLDGTNINNFWNKGTGSGSNGTSLGVDAIAEFQTLTNTYSAQFGGSGAVMNAVTKSGTNALHGTVYEFLRNSALDARPIQLGVPSRDQPFRRNQFGGALGGPVKKDKAFFFVNYEGLRQALGVTGTIIVPDTNARNGILPCASAPGSPCNNGLATVGFADAASSNPRLQKILNDYPVPAPGGTNLGNGTVRQSVSGSQPANENYFVARFDYSLSASDSLFARYVSDRGDQIYPFPNSGFGQWPETEQTRNQYATVEERHIFSPALVNLARISFVRPTDYEVLANVSLPELSFGRPMNAAISPGNSLTTIGPFQVLPTAITTTRYAVGDDFLWTHGSHSLSLGFSVTRPEDNVTSPFFLGGQWNFPNLQAYMLNKPLIFIASVPGHTDATRDFRETVFAFYVHDDWKVNPRLTLNIGVRYEPTTNITERRNKFHNITNVLTDTAYNSVATAFQSNPSLHNFDPRFGFAFDPFKDHKTSIRGGFGLFYNTVMARTVATGLYNTEPYIYGSQLGSAVLPPQAPQATFPAGFAPGFAVAPNQGQGINYYSDKTPRMMQYNLNVQRQFAGTVLTVGYVGSQGRHLFAGQDINPPILTKSANGTLVTGTAGPAGVTPNPRLNPALGNLTMLNATGSSNYNSLQVSANHRFSRGFQTQLSYTWSKSLDTVSSSTGLENNGLSYYTNPYNARQDYGRSGFDRTHSLRLSGVYALPFHQNKFVDGWQVSGILSRLSGAPLTLTNGYDSLADAANGQNGNSRPNYVAGCQLFVGSLTQWYNTSCLQKPLAGTNGNLGKGILSGPGFINADVSLIKDTRIPKISEQFAVQFRAEFFNVFNHLNYPTPTTLTAVFTSLAAPGYSPSAGTFSGGPVTPNREIQFGLKVTF